MTSPTAAARLLVAAPTAATTLFLAATVACASAPSFTARLEATTQTPKQATRDLHAAGSFTATALPAKDGYRLHWQLSYGRLTGPATAAYLRVGKAGQTGPAWLLLCSPCTTGAQGSAYFSPPQYLAAQHGDAYIAIYTAKNPAGEIRGQLAPS